MSSAVADEAGQVAGSSGSDRSDGSDGPATRRVSRDGRPVAGTGERDRDSSGRPRQARPRDALGRPLPYDAAGEPPISEDPLPPEETVRSAQALLRGGRPFAAHETYEVAWKHRPAAERELWHGMAQLCAGYTHAARGNAVGAARLIDRGAARLATYAASGGPTYGLDLRALLDDPRHPDGAHARPESS